MPIALVHWNSFYDLSKTGFSSQDALQSNISSNGQCNMISVLYLQAGVEELHMRGLIGWDLHDHRTLDPGHIQPDHCGRERELRALPLRPVPGGPPGLHLRPADLHRHQHGPLPGPQEVHPVDLHRSCAGFRGRDAVPDLLGHLRPGAEAQGLHEAVHEPVTATSGS